MLAQAYDPLASSAYGELAGIRLVTTLEGVGTDPFTAAQAVDAGATSGSADASHSSCRLRKETRMNSIFYIIGVIVVVIIVLKILGLY